MYSVETYVSVTWLWLIFPGLVVLISLVFLLATMVKNSGRRAKVWKSSSLAALSGLSIETRAHLGDLTSTATVEERAQGIKVRLIEDEGRWKLDIE
jgi:hypothetical protein